MGETGNDGKIRANGLMNGAMHETIDAIGDIIGATHETIGTILRP